MRLFSLVAVASSFRLSVTNATAETQPIGQYETREEACAYCKSRNPDHECRAGHCDCDGDCKKSDCARAKKYCWAVYPGCEKLTKCE
mmetsp:Transcript_914/g.1855  ORF Transcript_914/g.1855 Transcript_914/m.1855 type:complete len:87 (-) Transcript_914:113-373(-)